MKLGRLTDFFFVGLGVLPVTFLLSGYPELAVFTFMPLLIAACLCGGIQQFEDEEVEDREREDKGGGDAQPKDTKGLTFRNSEGENRKTKK